jgi:hypothetical protein
VRASVCSSVCRRERPVWPDGRQYGATAGKAAAAAGIGGDQGHPEIDFQTTGRSKDAPTTAAAGRAPEAARASDLAGQRLTRLPAAAPTPLVATPGAAAWPMPSRRHKRDLRSQPLPPPESRA